MAKDILGRIRGFLPGVFNTLPSNVIENCAVYIVRFSQNKYTLNRLKISHLAMLSFRGGDDIDVLVKPRPARYRLVNRRDLRKIGRFSIA